MSILSFSFLVFVLGLLVVYYIIPSKHRWIVLLIGSIIFYYLSSKKLMVFIILSTIITYLIGLSLSKYNKKISDLKSSKLKEEKKNELKEKYKKDKKRIVILGVCFNILGIIVTKYSGFLIENINNLLGLVNIDLGFTISKILLPLGVSYYTLEAISYIVDIYRSKYEGEKNIFKVALYLWYFPKITEGPFTRFNELSKNFFEDNKLKINNIIIGLDLIIYGLFKKMVIADRAGIFVNQIFGSNMGGITVVGAMILYTIQIYAEFSGCIDIIRGVSLLFSIPLPLNFKRPFFSKSIQEFWQRWHISLGAWIKEYVFYPVSLSKMNTKVSKFSHEKLKPFLAKFIMVAFPLLFVWIVNGIWHGASFKYLLYGMYYYLVMMIGLLIKPIIDWIVKKLKIQGNLLKGLQIIRTCILVIIGMTLFRSSTISEFGTMLVNIFHKGNGLLNHGLVRIDFIILIISNLFILLVGILEEKNKINIEKGFTNNPIVRSIVYTILICTIIMFGIYGEVYNAADFIYGAF